MIKRFILILLLCAILASCLVSCKNTGGSQDPTPDSPGETIDPVLREEREEIKELFVFLQGEAANEKKVSLEIQYQDEHYSFKQSGEYADAFWFSSSLLVTVICDYGFAKEEEWYLSCESKSSKALNQAFFDANGDVLGDKYFTLLDGVQGLHFDYMHNDGNLSAVLDDFYSEYEGISALYELECVRSVKIVYFYSMPDAFFNN